MNGARPSHMEWQGKVYSRSGKSEKYPDFVKSTGYGTGDGLKGWNCRHDFFPFFEGSEPAYTQEELAEFENRKVTYNDVEMTEYEASQKQRAYERRIRATKRELAGYDAGINATDDESLKADLQAAFDRKSVLLKKQEAAIKDFTHQTGLYRDRAREQSYGFNKSVSQKAVYSNKRALQIVEEKRIIQEKETKRIRKEILSGKYPITLNVGNQNKHIVSSHSYNPADKKSYLFGDLKTAQEFVDKYHGTGEIKLTNEGKWTNKEFISVEFDIGMVFNNELGIFQPTNRFSIHYGKKGTHIVPRKKE